MVFETFAKNKRAGRTAFMPDSPRITRENVPVRILEWILNEEPKDVLEHPTHCKKTIFLWEKEIIRENKKVVPRNNGTTYD